jgi:hypothetical protein
MKLFPKIKETAFFISKKWINPD